MFDRTRGCVGHCKMNRETYPRRLHHTTQVIFFIFIFSFLPPMGTQTGVFRTAPLGRDGNNKPRFERQITQSPLE